MVGDIVHVCLFVFAFVQSMASVLVSKGPNLPEPGLFDACSIKTPWTTIVLAVDGIVHWFERTGTSSKWWEIARSLHACCSACFDGNVAAILRLSDMAW